MKLVRSCLLLLLLTGIVAAGELDDLTEAWVRYFATEDSAEIAEVMEIDPSGNPVIAGFTSPAVTHEYYTVAKFDPEGNELWHASYNHADRSNYCTGLAIDGAGNIIMIGRSDSSLAYPYNQNWVTVKFDPDGNQQWVGEFYGPNAGSDRPGVVATDDDGNIYVGGTIMDADNIRRLAVVKYSPDGTQQWDVTYDSMPSHYVYSPAAIHVYNNSAVYVTGNMVNDDQSTNYSLLMYDLDGEFIMLSSWWADGNLLITSALHQDGNVVLLGRGGEYPDQRLITSLYDSDGDEVWEATYPEGDNEDVYTAISVTVDTSGNIYTLGKAQDQETYDNDWVIVKYDASGNLLWAEEYDGVFEDDQDEPRGLVVDNDENVYVTGAIGSWTDGFQTVTLMYGSDGSGLDTALFDGGYETDWINDIAIDNDGVVYVSGYTYIREADTTAVFTLIRYGEDTGVDEQPALSHPTDFRLVDAWPNPFNSTLRIRYELNQGAPITISLYDLLGREVTRLTSGVKPAGQYELTWNAENLASGTYLVSIQSQGRQDTRRVTLLK